MPSWKHPPSSLEMVMVCGVRFLRVWLDIAHASPVWPLPCGMAPFQYPSQCTPRRCSHKWSWGERRRPPPSRLSLLLLLLRSIGTVLERGARTCMPYAFRKRTSGGDFLSVRVSSTPTPPSLYQSQYPSPEGMGREKGRTGGYRPFPFLLPWVPFYRHER